MRSLRLRLILSHVLPLLLVILLVGVALDYVLGTRILLTNLAGELTGQAVLVAELATDKPEIWQDSVQAQASLDRLGLRLAARAMLLDSEGRLLASTDPADAERVEQTLEEIPDLDDVLAGEVNVHTNYSLYSEADIVDVLVPAWGPDRQVIGVVRLTHQLANVYEQFLTLRFLVAGVLVAGLVLGTVVAWSLALNLGRSLQRVTQAVHRLAASYGAPEGQTRLEPLAEQGPDEIRLLLRAVNVLVGRLLTLETTRRQLLSNLVHELGRHGFQCFEYLLGAFSLDYDFSEGSLNSHPYLSHCRFVLQLKHTHSPYQSSTSLSYFS